MLTFINSPCFYIITHVKTGKFYLGSTKNINKRYADHTRDLVKNNHHCKKLQEAYNDDPELKLDYVLCETRDLAYSAEQKLLTLHKGNPFLCNTNLKTGYRDEEVDKKVSEKTRNRPQYLKDIAIKALRDNQPRSEHWIGKKHRPETLEKMKLSSRTSLASIERLKNFLLTCSKRIIADGKIYPSASEAARVYGVHNSTIHFRCKSDNFQNFNYLD